MRRISCFELALRRKSYFQFALRRKLYFQIAFRKNSLGFFEDIRKLEKFTFEEDTTVFQLLELL